jgi:hypothetical protein
VLEICTVPASKSTSDQIVARASPIRTPVANMKNTKSGRSCRRAFVSPESSASSSMRSAAESARGGSLGVDSMRSTSRFPRLSDRALVGKNAQNDLHLPRRRDPRWTLDRPPPGLTSRSCPHNRSARNLDPGQAHPTRRRLRSFTRWLQGLRPALLHCGQRRPRISHGCGPRGLFRQCVSPGTTCNSYGADAPSGSSCIVSLGVLADRALSCSRRR